MPPRRSSSPPRKEFSWSTLGWYLILNFFCLLLLSMPFHFLPKDWKSGVGSEERVKKGAEKGGEFLEMDGSKREFLDAMKSFLEMDGLKREFLDAMKSLKKSNEDSLEILKSLKHFQGKEEKMEQLYNSLTELKTEILLAKEKQMSENHQTENASDYALFSGGGKVVWHSEPFTRGEASNSSGNGVHPYAESLLLKGSKGFVQIKLGTAIIPEAVTVEAFNTSDAPKQGPDLEGSTDADKMFLLAEFTYDLEKSSAQTFDVLDAAGVGIIDTVRLDFSSNHGSLSHTCIYRLRVHGHEPVEMQS